jgi:hypothetical protein
MLVRVFLSEIYCILFKDVVSSVDGRMINQKVIGKGLKISGHGLISIFLRSPLT